MKSGKQVNCLQAGGEGELLLCVCECVCVCSMMHHYTHKYFGMLLDKRLFCACIMNKQDKEGLGLLTVIDSYKWLCNSLGILS